MQGGGRCRSHRRTGRGTGNAREGTPERSGSAGTPSRQARAAKRGGGGGKLGTRFGRKSCTLRRVASLKVNRLRGLSI